MKLIESLSKKFRKLSKVMKTIIVVSLVPVVLFLGIFFYATSTVLIDTVFGTDLSKTVNNEEYQKEQEKLKVEKEQQDKLDKEIKSNEDAKLKEERVEQTEVNKDSTKETSNIKEKEQSKKEDNISYDKLQQLYLNIKSEMTYDEVLSIITESGLPFSETKFNGSKAIKVAFEKGVTPQKYADSGDYIDISFDDEDRDGNYIFGTIEYYNNDKFITVFEYKDGTYWDFRKGEDRGLYINNYKTITGDKSEKYIKVSNKEEQLKYVINYLNE